MIRNIFSSIASDSYVDTSEKKPQKTPPKLELKNQMEDKTPMC